MKQSGNKTKILLVEDEEDIADLIKMQAELAGYKVVVESDGLNGLRAVEREKPDLCILDVMLPGQSGLDVCRKIKSNPNTQHIPVIIISAKGEELDIVLGLELGADDYVSKPFSTKVLFSRVRAVLRRGKEAEKPPKVITFGPFSLDLDNYQLTKKGKPIQLTLSELGILRRLLLNKGKVLTRNQLLDDIPNSDALIDRNIDVHVAALRRKLGPNFQGIETVRGVGYRFTSEDD
jgi:two-component system, OmpR family, alkaline phosphatase synthesis response regulator PhoP